MTAKEKIDKILGITELEINDFAMKCGIIPNSLKAAIKRDALTDDIVTKIHDKFHVRKGFFKDGLEPIIDENGTHGDNEAAIAEKTLGEMEAFKKLVEGGTEYLLVPRTAFEGAYRFVPVEQIANQTKELEIKAQELARKDAQIQNLTSAVTDVIRQMISGRLPELSKIEEAQKNTAV